jgi:UDP-N-acetylmuramoyl-L-alanyl-D-glutamate--2,6-diaminopimelate ligase
MTNAGKRTLGFVLGLSSVHPLATQVAGNVRTDSREVGAGDVFFARQGQNVDGRRFIGAALERGAQAVVVEDDRFDLPRDRRIIRVNDFDETLGAAAARLHGEPAHHLRVVGVTGTNGKTTVAHLVASALNVDVESRGSGRRCGLIGTLGIGWPDALETSVHTTPEVTLTQAALARFVGAGADAAVMEVSSHGISQGRIAGIEFDTAVFTNLSRDHLDYHADMHAYGETKARLFTEAKPRCSVINVDDSYGELLFGRCSGEKFALSVGAPSRSSVVTAQVVSAPHKPVALEICGPLGQGLVESQLLGGFNAYNLLTAAAVLATGGMTMSDACGRLQAVKPVPGRMQWIGGGSQPLVVIDYSHTPDALDNALRCLRLEAGARLWCVFGCGGDRDAGKRPLMAQIAERHADRIIVTDDNPRTEESALIIENIVAGFSHPTSHNVIAERAEAIDTAVRSAAPNDIVLVAGKGHETYQERDGTRTPFSDIDEARLALRRRNENCNATRNSGRGDRQRWQN